MGPSIFMSLQLSGNTLQTGKIPSELMTKIILGK